MMISLSFFIMNLFLSVTASEQDLQGAWQSHEGVMIFSGNYFAFTAYAETGFKYTYGGSWNLNDNEIICTHEFHTKNPDEVGKTDQIKADINGNSMKFGGTEFIRLDDGNPGKLSGTWLFTNRVRNGEMGPPRSQDNPRKTMKILSGTRFQWIAYNVETREFMGTGGGTYTTIDGKYTENIDFFSRDNSRVGASLEFDFEIKGDEWHHKGLSSRGDPIYEIWSRRK